MDSKQLLKALWCDPEAFAAGGEILNPVGSSVVVEGAGRIDLPLSTDGLDKLKIVSRQAPYGLLDTEVRKAWQVDAGRVSCPENPDFFTKVVDDLAATAVASLGMDAVGLELKANLYKLLLYEAGGHFKFHRDTEKEDGMFATMIIQLPTQSGHTGGALSVRQGQDVRTFDFSGDSSSRYFSTVFFCDCEHELAKVTSGSRLCLVFSLVRNNPSFVPVDRVSSFVSALPPTQAWLRAWTNQAERKLLAIPLAHKYSKKNLSFSGLKGHDRVVAALLRSCDFLELHLCLLTKHTTVTEDPEYDYSMDDWISADDEPTRFKKRSLDLQDVPRWSKEDEDDVAEDDVDEDDELSYRCRDPSGHVFDFLEDEFRGTGRMAGNEGGTDEYFYHVAALVAWPKGKRVEALCSRLQDVAATLEWLKEEIGNEFTSSTPARENLRELAQMFLSGVFDHVHEGFGRSFYRRRVEHDLPSLLEMCVNYELREEALSIMRKWGGTLLRVARNEMASAVCALDCRELIEDIVKQVDVSSVGGFPDLLASCGRKDIATSVGKLLCARVVPEDLFQPSKNGHILALLKFCVKASDHELRGEVTSILNKALTGMDKLSPLMLAMGMVYCPEQAQAVHRFWEGRKEKVENSIKEKGVVYASAEQAAMLPTYYADLVAFSLELESLGWHEVAVGFLSKPLPGGIAELERKYHGENVACKYSSYQAFYRLSSQEQEAAMILLLHHGKYERVHTKISEASRYESKRKIGMSLIRAAGILEVNKNEEMKRQFNKIFQLVLGEVLAGGAADKNSFVKMFFRMLLSLGDEDVVGDMVKGLSKAMNWNLTRMILDRKDGLLEEAVELGGVWKRELKKLVEARMEYLSREPSFKETAKSIKEVAEDIKDVPMLTKKRRLCEVVHVCQAQNDPRRQRRVHELILEEWNGCSKEKEELELLNNILS